MRTQALADHSIENLNKILLCFPCLAELKGHISVDIILVQQQELLSDQWVVT